MDYFECTMNKRIAIIGASTGQLPLCLKAKEMGLETFCFAWPQGAVCKDYVDHFVPISIMEMEEISQYCYENQIDGVVSNASETTALVSAYIAEKLGKNTTPFSVFKKIQNKTFVREQTNSIPGLHPVRFQYGTIEDILSSFPVPYVLKPVRGAAKKGVNFVDKGNADLTIPEDLKNEMFMAEAFISGKEYSIECLSFHNQHEVIQITEKITTGAPHFVELEHHQPAELSTDIKDRIIGLIPQVLTRICFTNGASHIEIKIDNEDNIYLIEVNPRGGGDWISNKLVSLSTDCDYLKQMILISLDIYNPSLIHNIAYSGIYFLSAYSSRLLPFFEKPKADWMIMRERSQKELTMSSSNYDRDGFILYCSNKKILI